MAAVICMLLCQLRLAICTLHCHLCQQPPCLPLAATGALLDELLASQPTKVWGVGQHLHINL